jgi:hypothetical protein
MGVGDRPGPYPAKANSSGALERPSLVRGDSDPTNGAGPPAPVRHISADALGNGAGVAVNAHSSAGSVSRTPPGSLNLAGLGLRVEQKRVF